MYVDRRIELGWLDDLRTRRPELIPRVVHCRRDPYDLYIGRPSKWGNPYRIGPDGDREQVIRRFEHHLRFERGDLLDDLAELHGTVLGCWCAPSPCHGDVLAALIAEAHGLAGRCENCQRLFPRARTGRHREFCDGRCRQQHHRRQAFRDTAVTEAWRS